MNAINPGFVVTEGTHTAGIAGSDFERNAVASTPLGRAGQPEDIAPPVAFLASDDARWITGKTDLRLRWRGHVIGPHPVSIGVFRRTASAEAHRRPASGAPHLTIDGSRGTARSLD